MENPIKMDDLGVPLFSETSISNYQVLQQPSEQKWHQRRLMFLWLRLFEEETVFHPASTWSFEIKD